MFFGWTGTELVKIADIRMTSPCLVVNLLVRGMNYYLVSHACVRINRTIAWHHSCDLVSVVARLWLILIMVCNVSRIYYPTRSFCGCDRIWVLSSIIWISLSIDCLIDLLLHKLLLLLHIHLSVCIWLCIWITHHLLRSELLSVFKFFSFSTHLILVVSNLRILLLNCCISLRTLRHDSLHYKPSFSLICWSWKNLLFLAWMWLDNNLSIIFIFHRLLLSVAGLSIESGLHLLLIIVLTCLV